MTTPFEFIDAINSSKVDLLREDPTAEKDYNSFIINRGLSNFHDTIFYANEMNRYGNIPRDWQFSFYLHSIKPKKRFSKWHKKEQASDDLKLVMRAYNYTESKAMTALQLLSQEQLVELRQIYTKGGA